MSGMARLKATLALLALGALAGGGVWSRAQEAAPGDAPATSQESQDRQTKDQAPGKADNSLKKETKGSAETKQADKKSRSPAETPPRAVEDPSRPGEAAQPRDEAARRRPAAEARDSARPADEADSLRRGADRRGDDRTQRGTESRTTGRQGAPARIGLQFDERAEGVLTIQNIEEGSLAAQAGFQVRDRILSIDGRAVTNPRQLQAFWRGQSGRTVPVIIERGGQRYTIHLATWQPDSQGAWLGVYLQDSEGDQAGARITGVYPGGPAARAGFRRGDVIVQLNGQRIASTPDLIAAIDEFEPRSRVDFGVLRNNREMAIAAVLGSREHFVYYPDENEAGNQPGGGREEDDYEFSNVPPYVMQLEHDRRMAEQHQRIEMTLQKLTEEIRQLREALGQRRESPR